MSTTRKPAKNPCGSCPYRRDVPSGVWEREEYAKLPSFDRPTFEQPPSVFLCHQQDGRVCSGWAGCHDMTESLGVRMGVVTGFLTAEEAEAIVDHEAGVPLFDSGAEAAAHGMADMDAPGERARRVIDKLEDRAGRR